MPIHRKMGDVFSIDSCLSPHALVIWVSQGYNGMSSEYHQFINRLRFVTIHEFQDGSWEELDGTDELPRGSGVEKRVFRICRDNLPDLYLYLLPVAHPQVHDLERLVCSGLSFCKDHGVVTVAFNGIKPVNREDVPENANAMIKAGTDWLESNPDVSLKDIWFVDKNGRFIPN